MSNFLDSCFLLILCLRFVVVFFCLVLYYLATSLILRSKSYVTALLQKKILQSRNSFCRCSFFPRLLITITAVYLFSFYSNYKPTRWLARRFFPGIFSHCHVHRATNMKASWKQRTFIHMETWGIFPFNTLNMYFLSNWEFLMKLNFKMLPNI